jgi:hypothetical protein
MTYLNGFQAHALSYEDDYVMFLWKASDLGVIDDKLCDELIRQGVKGLKELDWVLEQMKQYGYGVNFNVE